jgi:hypothetical protein
VPRFGTLNAKHVLSTLLKIAEGGAIIYVTFLLPINRIMAPTAKDWIIIPNHYGTSFHSTSPTLFDRSFLNDPIALLYNI